MDETVKALIASQTLKLFQYEQVVATYQTQFQQLNEAIKGEPEFKEGVQIVGVALAVLARQKKEIAAMMEQMHAAALIKGGTPTHEGSIP